MQSLSFPFLAALAAILLAPAMVSAQAGPPWSAPSGGVRGRLVTNDAAVAAGGRFHVWLEVENVGSSSVTLRVADPFAFVPELHAPSGTLPASLVRSEVLSSPHTVMLAPGERRRFELTIVGEDSPRATLDVTTHIWTLPTGTYELSGRYESDGISVALPALALRVR